MLNETHIPFSWYSWYLILYSVLTSSSFFKKDKSLDYNTLSIGLSELKWNAKNPGSGSAENLKYNEIAEWDSIGHMQMIAELEDAFEIEFEMDDIIDFSSYNKGFEILEKYGIKIN